MSGPPDHRSLPRSGGPRRVDRYEVIREIARGGMCTVSAAVHAHTRRAVALKQLLPGVSGNNVEERLMQEAMALEACRSPHVVDVLDAGVDAAGMTFVALEMLEGRSVDDLLATRQRLPWNDALKITLDTLSALRVVHGRGFVHRDIKPGNVFIAKSTEAGGNVERVKLIDFGVAHVPVEGDAEALTRADERLGTFEYVAPEQFFGEGMSAGVDLYAVCVSLYEMISGTVPHVGGYPEMIARMTSETPPTPLTSLAEVPAEIAKVIHRGLSYDTEARYPTALSLASALVAAAPGPLLSRSILDPPPTSVRKPRAHPRAAYVTPLRVTTEDGVIDGHTADVSAGGMLAMLRSSPRAGRITLRFCLPVSGKVVSTDATVRWSKVARPHHAVGLQFTNSSAEATEDIARFAKLAAAM